MRPFFAGLYNGQSSQHQRQNPNIRARFDGGFGIPTGAVGTKWVDLTLRIETKWLPAPGQNVKVTVMRRAAKKIGDDKADQAAQGQGPLPHLFQADGTIAKVLGHHLVHRTELHQSQTEAQQDQHQQPGSQRQSKAGGGLSPPQNEQTAKRIVAADQQHIVGDFDVPGQRLYPQDQGARYHVRDGRVAPQAFFFLLANNNLNQRQKQRQPDCPGNDHGEDYADDKKGAQRVGQAAHQGAQPGNPQRPQKYIHAQTGQPQLRHGEPTVSFIERQNIKKQAKWIEGRVLSIGQKGLAGEDIGIPQGQLPGGDGLADEFFPDVIFQNQIRQELILGQTDAQSFLIRSPRLIGKEIVNRKEGIWSKGNGPEEQQRQQ